MKVFLFGRQNIGDSIILKLVKDSLKLDCEYLGDRVDLSRIKPEEENLIIVINNYIYQLDLDKVVGYIMKDPTKPLVVVNKLKTFGAIAFKEDLEIDRIITNKLYIFSGILYIPKSYLKDTIANVFRNIDTKELRVYIIPGGK